MTPDVHIRLTSVSHGLRDVIVPAVDKGASLAQEQCGLVLAQLDMLLRQLPWIERYPALCRDDLRATVPEIGDAQADYDRIGFGVEALVFAVARDGAPAYRARVDAEILRFSRRQNTRERTWFAGNGFDPRPEEIGSLAEMFTE